MAEINGSLSEQQEISGSTSPVGPMGPRGYTGNGIESIEKTGTSGLVDTYTITYTDGNNTTFEVTNGERGADGNDGADGHDGISPTFETEQIEGGHRLTIVDAEGTHTVDLMDGTNGTNGTNGTDGVSPTISSSSITGGHRLTITDKNGTSTVDVMDGQQGQTGQTGATGADGYSPTASVSKSGGTATITITDKNGTTTAQVSDGQNGQDGSNGNDGYSPTATVTKSGSTATISITDKNGTTTATVSDGAAGTTDYTDMTNKPQINSVTLSGNKSLSDLGIHNLPPSGSSGQVLAKSSNTDYAVQWKTNSLQNLSDTRNIENADELAVLTWGGFGKWEPQQIRTNLGTIMDDGEGNTILVMNGGLPACGFTGFVTDDTSENYAEYDYLWTVTDRNENEEDIRYTYYFVGKELSTPYDLKIRKFVEEWNDQTYEWSPAYEQTAAGTHEVSHTWIGTAAQYAALSPDYDAHTIYYITQ